MSAISVTAIGPRRPIAEGRTISAQDAVQPSFRGQDHTALFKLVPLAGTHPSPRLDVITIPGGYLRFGHNQDGIAVTAEGDLISETAMFSYDYAWPGLDALRAEAREIDEDWVTVVDSAWHNYFHLLTFAIPRLYLARTHLPDARVAVPARRPKNPDDGRRPAMLDQMIALSGLGDRVRYVEDGLYRVRNLHVIWTSTPQPTDLHLFEEIQAAFADLARRAGPAPGRSPRRIFIVRAQNSRLKDPAALRTLDRYLKRYGFEKVRLEHLSLEGQIRLFAGATHVVAAHGAGLSNVVFANPRLRILELNSELDDPGVLRPWFLMLAYGRRLHYQYLNATAYEMGEVALGVAFDRLMQVRGQNLRFRLALYRMRLKAAIQARAAMLRRPAD